ncbi:LacI family transcriptional regulator, partial [candidate division KSB1 bacterium]
AIEILLKSLSGQENEYQKVVLPTKLVVRESCGAQIQEE